MEKERQIYQQNKENNDKIVGAINKQTDVLKAIASMKGDDGYTPLPDVDYPSIETIESKIDAISPKKGVTYFTEEEIQLIKKDVLDRIDAGFRDNLIEDTISKIEIPVVDYSKLETFVIDEIAKIPKPEVGEKESIDINAIVIEVLGKIPEQKEIVVDYKKIEDFCAEEILRIERSRPRVLQSAGPTTRLNDLADVEISGLTTGQVLVWNATLNTWENGSAGSASPLTTKGDLYGFSTVDARIPVGANDYVLTADSTDPLGVSWQPPQTGGTFVYYWTSTASDVATYYKQTDTPQVALDNASFVGATNGQLLRTYVTEPSNPSLTIIPAGEYRLHIHANVATLTGKKDTYLRAEVWEVNSAGVDIVKLADAGPSTILTAVSAEYIISYTSPQVTLSSTTSRIATKVYAVVSGSGGDPDITLSVGDGSDSNTTIPAVTVNATNFVPYTGATTNLDMGARTVTASSFIGSGGSLTGIDHNTLSNLTVGDVHTQYLFGAGRATPQTFAFGTASGASTGYITSTFHATKGKYFLNAAGTISVDEVNVRLGIGIATPLYKLHVPTGTSYIGTILGVGTAAASGSFNFEVTGSSFFSSTTYFRTVGYFYNGSTNYMGIQAISTTNKIFTIAANVNKDIEIQNGDVRTALFSNSASVATMTLGTAGATIGVLALSGNTSGVISIKPQATAGTYNFNLPTSAGSSGQPLLSAGGAGSPMTFGTLGIAGGGTGVTTITMNGIAYGGGSLLYTSSVNNAILVTNMTGTPSLSTTLPDFTAGTITFADSGKNIVLGTTTGTKFGTATTQKIGFYNATPIVQGASVADATGGVVIDAEARTAINALISRIEALGLIATI